MALFFITEYKSILVTFFICILFWLYFIFSLVWGVAKEIIEKFKKWINEKEERVIQKKPRLKKSKFTESTFWLDINKRETAVFSMGDLKKVFSGGKKKVMTFFLYWIYRMIIKLLKVLATIIRKDIFSNIYHFLTDSTSDERMEIQKE